MYEKYRDRIEFLCVYIQEAHPSDGWRVPINEAQGVVFAQPKSEKERVGVAGACMLDLKLNLPMVLDEMSNDVDSAYAALPERLYLIDAEGRVCFRSGPGPWGFDVDAWEKAISEEIE